MAMLKIGLVEVHLVKGLNLMHGIFTLGGLSLTG